MIYQERFYQLLNYIDTHLDEQLTVERLSNIACLSKYHFHRQFFSLFGVSAFAYIKQARMKRASYQLSFKKEMRIVDVAVANGYESSEAFSRAFRQAIGQNPSRFRDQPKWNPWHEKYHLFKNLRIQCMKSVTNIQQVKIVHFNETKVAVLEHLGALELIENTICSFIEWRKENKLSPKKSRTFNIIYDDPSVVEQGKYRCDICASIKSDVKENNYGVITKSIAAGRCAVIRHIGSDDGLSKIVNYLYSQWLPQSGEELRDYPLFFERINLFPDVCEAEITTDIYLPLN